MAATQHKKTVPILKQRRQQRLADKTRATRDQDIHRSIPSVIGSVYRSGVGLDQKLDKASRYAGRVV